MGRAKEITAVISRKTFTMKSQDSLAFCIYKLYTISNRKSVNNMKVYQYRSILRLGFLTNSVKLML